MESLPELENFQVIVFSDHDQPRFLLGKDGTWIKFEQATSPRRGADAVARLTEGLARWTAAPTCTTPLNWPFRFRNNPHPTRYHLPLLGRPAQCRPGCSRGRDQPPPVEWALQNGIDADRMELGRRLRRPFTQMRLTAGVESGPEARPEVRPGAPSMRPRLLLRSADLGAFLCSPWLGITTVRWHVQTVSSVAAGDPPPVLTLAKSTPAKRKREIQPRLRFGLVCSSFEPSDTPAGNTPYPRRRRLSRRAEYRHIY